MECIAFVVALTGAGCGSNFTTLFVDGAIICGGLSRTGSNTDGMTEGTGTIGSLEGATVGAAVVEHVGGIVNGGIAGTG